MPKKTNTGFAAAMITIVAIMFLTNVGTAAAMTITIGSDNVITSYISGGTNFLDSLDISSLFQADYFSSSALAGVDADITKKAAIIDEYFKERDMPLFGLGNAMMIASYANDIDWRLLPAIAIRESSGGKYACDNNPFGWASCKDNFRSTEESIEVVAWNLGGHNPKTARYYGGDIRTKLHHYNGTVIAEYPDQVLRIMDKIASD